MKKYRMPIALVAVAAVVAGIALLGNASPYISGSCFFIAAAACFYSVYLNVKKEP